MSERLLHWLHRPKTRNLCMIRTVVIRPIDTFDNMLSSQAIGDRPGTEVKSFIPKSRDCLERVVG